MAFRGLGQARWPSRRRRRGGGPLVAAKPCGIVNSCGVASPDRKRNSQNTFSSCGRSTVDCGASQGANSRCQGTVQYYSSARNTGGESVEELLAIPGFQWAGATTGSQGTTDPKLLGEAHPSSCTRQVRFFLLAQTLQRSPRECARQRFPSSLAPEQQAAPSVARPWKREENYSPSWQKGDCMATARYMLVCDTEPLLHTRDGAVTAAETSNGRRADIGCRSLRQIVRQITRTGVQRKKPFARNLHHKCVPSPQKEANNHHFGVRVTGRRVKEMQKSFILQDEMLS